MEAEGFGTEEETCQHVEEREEDLPEQTVRMKREGVSQQGRVAVGVPVERVFILADEIGSVQKDVVVDVGVFEGGGIVLFRVRVAAATVSRIRRVFIHVDQEDYREAEEEG